MQLSDYRERIDALDAELVKTFSQRMGISGEIARFKAAGQLPIHDHASEREKLEQVAELVPPPLRNYTQRLYQLIF